MTLNHQNLNNAGKCIRCGLCMSVCPVYQESLEERDVARGKMALIEGEQNSFKLKDTLQFKEAISRCLLCGACAHICPNKVQTNDCIQSMRQRMTATIKEKILISSLSTLSSQTLSGQIFRKSSSVFQKCVGKEISEQSGLHLRFPLTSISHRKWIPRISSSPFTSQYTLASNSPKKILYFTGCGANYLFNPTAAALIDILQNINQVPIVPDKQMCCGLPFYAAGDHQKAISLAKKNIDIIENFSPAILLTTCGSCGAQIHQWKQLLKNDSNYGQRALRIAALHKDATDFILESDYFKKMIPSQSDTIVENIWYHHPCHMRWGDAQLELPKKLFKPFNQVNVTYSNDQCCGYGGKFQISHFDLSMKIFHRRVDSFKQGNIDRILTSCTGCHLQFLEGLLQNDMSVSVMHPLDWLNRVVKKRKNITN